MKKNIFLSTFGQLLLYAHKGKLIYCNWKEKDCDKKAGKILQIINQEEETEGDEEVLNLASRRLNEYFSGVRQNFDVPIELHGTPFQKLVWLHLQEIPYSKTISYRELATLCGGPNLSRAVAGACGANPIAIFIPCHRVTASGKGLGGYTGGLEKKIHLLNLEKIG